MRRAPDSRMRAIEVPASQRKGTRVTRRDAHLGARERGPLLSSPAKAGPPAIPESVRARTEHVARMRACCARAASGAAAAARGGGGALSSNGAPSVVVGKFEHGPDLSSPRFRCAAALPLPGAATPFVFGGAGPPAARRARRRCARRNTLTRTCSKSGPACLQAASPHPNPGAPEPRAPKRRLTRL
ncbi:hypothetical protein M885DRAFT_546600 [Pelagophyceae sp. CCMP2097]|nr:hypothetical protein M885DRAFT_546600 [Pelagophyceae sp. CCMP2097]